MIPPKQLCFASAEESKRCNIWKTPHALLHPPMPLHTQLLARTTLNANAVMCSCSVFFPQIPSPSAISREADKPVAGCQIAFTTHPRRFPDNSCGRHPGNRNSPWLENFPGAFWQVSPRELGFKGRGSGAGTASESRPSAVCAQARSASSWWGLHSHPRSSTWDSGEAVLT